MDSVYHLLTTFKDTDAYAINKYSGHTLTLQKKENEYLFISDSDSDPKNNLTEYSKYKYILNGNQNKFVGKGLYFKYLDNFVFVKYIVF